MSEIINNDVLKRLLEYGDEGLKKLNEEYKDSEEELSIIEDNSENILGGAVLLAYFRNAGGDEEFSKEDFIDIVKEKGCDILEAKAFKNNNNRKYIERLEKTRKSLFDKEVVKDLLKIGFLDKTDYVKFRDEKEGLEFLYEEFLKEIKNNKYESVVDVIRSVVYLHSHKLLYKNTYGLLKKSEIEKEDSKWVYTKYFKIEKSKEHGTL